MAPVASSSSPALAAAAETAAAAAAYSVAQQYIRAEGMASWCTGRVGAIGSEHKESSVRFSAGFVPQDFLVTRDGKRAALCDLHTPCLLISSLDLAAVRWPV